MQAVVLAAGRSVRFYPLNSQNKSFLRLCGKTILEHTLSSIKESGIKDVLVVVSDKEFASENLGESIKQELNITLIEQKEPLGMGDALLRCREFIEDDFFLLHATHVDFNDFYPEMEGKNSAVRKGMVDRTSCRTAAHRRNFSKPESDPLRRTNFSSRI